MLCFSRRPESRGRSYISNFALWCCLLTAAGLPVSHGAAANAVADASGSAAKEQAVAKIVVPPLETSAQAHMYYFPELAKLALQKTEATDGPFALEVYPEVLTSGRLFLKLRRNAGVNLMWGPAKHEEDANLLRVPVSLLRGLNSYRLLLIRAGDQAKFNAVDSLAELKALRGGMVSHWPDTRLLRSHNFSLVTPAHYELLFTLLEAGRIDYLSRGLYEVWEEQKAHQGRDIVIEKSLMLYYPGDMFFYVNGDNRELADRLERGLQIAIEDGSFEELFFSIPGFKRGYAEMTGHDRQVFYLYPPKPEHQY